jgi:hypothetical protein
MPQFFKVGNNQNHIEQFPQDELKLFWSLHSKWMNTIYQKELKDANK